MLLQTGSPLMLIVAAIVVLAVPLAVVHAADDDAGKALHAILDAEWERQLKEFPTFASRLGDRRYNTRWPDVSLGAIDRRYRQTEAVLKQLAKIDVDSLSDVDKVNYRLFRREYEMNAGANQFRWHLVPLTARDGIQDASSTGDSLRFDSVQDYEDWIARMRSFPVYMDQTIGLMREGIRANILQPKVVMKRVPAQIARQVVDNPEKSLFFKPFRRFADDIDEADRDRLAAAAKRAIAEQVVPAYRKLQSFFNDEYLPACYDRVGISQAPRGHEMYAHFARKFTTTDLTPQQIHDIGLREVRRIRAEMEKVVKQVKFKGSFAEFLEHLRHDPKFYFKDANELLAAYRAVCKKVDPQLVKLFSKLPRIPYGVEAIPMHIAPDTTTAYYRPPAADGSRAGTYFVNLYKLEVRPKYEIEALSLHEAVPGHHLQISLAMELEELPEFRRYGGYTAFVEGWALYGESLGGELGLYRDPYSKFGQLTYEMWRAVRLVVDTGMHDMQWSRERAIDFFAANTAKTMHDIENEIDRYIAWPGQALAYKIGELKIKELRARAEKELGDDFDIREFHEVVLSRGAVTLDILEDNVVAWIVRTKTAR